MKSVVIALPTVTLMDAVAQKLAHCIKVPAVLTFSGEIGAGKTTLIRSLLQNLGVAGAIKSPTFSLMETYLCGDLQIHHFDLYRINDETELDFIGFRDYFSANALCCIEWPERMDRYQVSADILFRLIIKGSGRELQAIATSALGNGMLTCMAENLGV